MAFLILLITILLASFIYWELSIQSIIFLGIIFFITNVIKLKNLNYILKRGLNINHKIVWKKRFYLNGILGIFLAIFIIAIPIAPPSFSLLYYYDNPGTSGAENALVNLNEIDSDADIYYSHSWTYYNIFSDEQYKSIEKSDSNQGERDKELSIEYSELRFMFLDKYN